MNATMNPNHANVNTLPYTLAGLSAGIERAFWLTGFTSGAFHRSLTSSIFAGEREVSVDDSSSTSYQGGLTDQEKLGLSFSKTTSMVFVAPPTQGTWRSNYYVNAVRLVDD